MKPTHTTHLPGVSAAAIPQRPPASDDPPLQEFGERLVHLGNGRRGLRSGLAVRADLPSAAPEPLANTIDFIASSETLDRADEIILAAGWRLENYRRNPVFQNAHQYGDVIFTLGRALITEVRTDVRGEPFLFQRVEFAVEANPMARIAYGLYKGRFLNAVSVGFIPLRWENGAPDSGCRRKYIEQELLEVSAVGIPANPDALRLGLKSGAIDKRDVRELADLCARTLEGAPPAAQDSEPILTAAPMAHTGALGNRSNEAQLLQLARELREFLRRA